jgi:hypothetical protein
MRFLMIRAYAKLVLFDLYLLRGNFQALHEKVKCFSTAEECPNPDVVEHICSAVDMACIWYWKEVLCLQRSAAATCLLKQFGVPAQMVIGVQQLPFKSHAWVEVDGKVATDKPYMREMYSVVESC